MFGITRQHRSRGLFLDFRLAALFLGAAIGMVGLYLEDRRFTWVAIAVLVVGVALGVADRRAATEDRMDEPEDDSTADEVIEADEPNR